MSRAWWAEDPGPADLASVTHEHSLRGWSGATHKVVRSSKTSETSKNGPIPAGVSKDAETSAETSKNGPIPAGVFVVGVVARPLLEGVSFRLPWLRPGPALVSALRSGTASSEGSWW